MASLTLCVTKFFCVVLDKDPLWDNLSCIIEDNCNETFRYIFNWERFNKISIVIL